MLTPPFFMDRIRTLLNYFQNALSDVNLGIDIFSIPRIQKLIIKLNTEKQLFRDGIDSKGVSLPLYSAFTELLNPKKKEGEPWTLKDTGGFYRSFIILVLNTGDAEISANTVFPGDRGEIVDLEAKASLFILGLTDESKRILAKAFKEEIIKKIRSETGRI